MIHRFVDFFSSGRVKRDGEKSGAKEHKSEHTVPLRQYPEVNDSDQPDSKPSFKDAEEGIDVKDIFIVSKFSKNSYLKYRAKIFLKEFKKIMEVEVL